MEIFIWIFFKDKSNPQKEVSRMVLSIDARRGRRDSWDISYSKRVNFVKMVATKLSDFVAIFINWTK